MAEDSTMYTAKASLCALGEYLRRRQFFRPLYQKLTIRQKKVKYHPVDKLIDGLLAILSGAKTISQSNVTVRVDRAIQRAFGRKGCADQSTIARTLKACTPENVTQTQEVLDDYLKRYGRTPKHPFSKKELWVDADLTPLPTGPTAEGSERAWMGRSRSKHGRKVLRVMATTYSEILHETLLRGTASAVAALKHAFLSLQGSLGWTKPERRGNRPPPGRGLWNNRCAQLGTRPRIPGGCKD